MPRNSVAGGVVDGVDGEEEEEVRAAKRAMDEATARYIALRVKRLKVETVRKAEEVVGPAAAAEVKRLPHAQVGQLLHSVYRASDSDVTPNGKRAAALFLHLSTPEAIADAFMAFGDDDDDFKRSVEEKTSP